MGGHDDISLPTSHRGLSAGPQDEGVGSHGDKSINMSSEVNLDEVPISKDGVGLTEQGGVVTDDVVNRDASWEGDTW